MSTRLDDIRRRVANDQQQAAIDGAYRRLDRLLDQQDRLDQIPGHSRPAGRQGQLFVAIRDARQRIAELQAIRDVEHAFGLGPTLDPLASPAVDRRGCPPSWKL